MKNIKYIILIILIIIFSSILFYGEEYVRIYQHFRQREARKTANIIKAARKYCISTSENKINKVADLLVKTNIEFDAIIADKSMNSCGNPNPISIDYFKNSRFVSTGKGSSFLQGHQPIVCFKITERNTVTASAAFDCSMDDVSLIKDSRIMERESFYFSSSDNKKSKVHSELLQETDAKNIMLSLVENLMLEGDLYFKSITYNDKASAWTSVWWRQQGGIPYEGDGLILTIDAKDGSFLYYQKAYYAKELASNAIISHKEAASIASSFFLNSALGNRPLSDFTVQQRHLLVRNDNLLNMSPVRWKNSVLAWIVVFQYTGGIPSPVAGYDYYNIESNNREWLSILTKNEQVKVRDYADKLVQMKGDMPPAFEVRIDAETGDIIWSTPLEPGWISYFTY